MDGREWDAQRVDDACGLCVVSSGDGDGACGDSRGHARVVCGDASFHPDAPCLSMEELELP